MTRRFFLLKPLSISIIISLITVSAYLIGFPLFDAIESKSFDFRFFIRGTKKTENKVVIVTIDEKSLDKLGKWPWPRKTIGKLIDSLSEYYDVNSVGLDVVFAEPDYNSESVLLNNVLQKTKTLNIKESNISTYLANLIQENDNDAILASAIKRSGKVVLGYFFYTSDEEHQHIKDINEDPLEHIERSSYSDIRYLTSSAKEIAFAKENFLVERNIDKLSREARGFGYFNMFPDFDGTVRWAPMIMKYKGKYFPPLSLQLARQYLGNPPIEIVAADYGVDRVILGDIDIPTDEAGNLLINYRGEQKTFPHYSVYDVINRNIPKNELKNKIIIIGATAIGIYDMWVTPFNSIYPGVEIHANIIDNILNEDFIIKPDWIALVDIFIVIVGALLLGVILPKLGPLSGAMAALALFVVFTGGNYYLFLNKGLWLNFVYPTFSSLSIYTVITLFHYTTEEREKKKIKNTFQYYMTSAVVNEVLKHPDKLKLGGEKKILSVLFSDIRNFTTISEKMTPEDLVHFLNEYLTVMTDIVFKYDGVLDKYIGDAIMAIYGAPIDQENHSLRACLTALEMMKKLRELQKSWKYKKLPEMDIGIGISTGPMVVGNMGSERRFDYTVMGNTVNLGSRLEGINKEYGTNIIISEETYNRVKKGIACREIDIVRVKGMDTPVKIFELLAEKRENEKCEKLVKKFESALHLYKAMKPQEAIDAFREVFQIKDNDPVSRMYIERCQILAKYPPPPDWDGVFTIKKQII